MSLTNLLFSSSKALLHKFRFAFAGCALGWLAGGCAEAGPKPAINVWYGLEQHFGQPGNPQPRINILGSVERSDEVDALSFSLNGGPATPLSMGVDLRRLARPGDFNIEIERGDLREGMNEAVINAALRGGGAVSTTVRVHYSPGRVWPLPYKIDWSKAERIQDVAEIMDGLWKLTPQGVRTMEPYYDRVIAIGDMQWTDYEVLTSVIFHKMLADVIAPKGPPYSSHAHASVLLRWRGHDNDGQQPRAKWHPTGGLAMFRANAGSEGNQWIWHGGESGFLAQENHTRPVEIGSRYYFKARVETFPGPKTRYSVKAWNAREEEPADWDLVGIDGAQDLQSGSLLLVVHHSDVTFGNVEVRSLASISWMRGARIGKRLICSAAMKKVSTTFSVSYRGGSCRRIARAPRGFAAAVAAATPSGVSPGAAGVRVLAACSAATPTPGHR